MSRPMKTFALPIAAIAGLATALLVSVALAKTFTLQVAKDAKVTNTAHVTKSETIIINSRGRAAYALTGDSKRHPECTKADGCFQFWLPVTVSSAKKLSKASSIKGKLGTWHRNGFTQVTLGGHPLYTFVLDTHKRAATGEGIKSFGGTWHVAKPSGSVGHAGTTTSGTTTGTTTTSCLYPPYC